MSTKATGRIMAEYISDLPRDEMNFGILSEATWQTDGPFETGEAAAAHAIANDVRGEGFVRVEEQTADGWKCTLRMNAATREVFFRKAPALASLGKR